MKKHKQIPHIWKVVNNHTSGFHRHEILDPTFDYIVDILFDGLFCINSIESLMEYHIDEEA